MPCRAVERRALCQRSGFGPMPACAAGAGQALVPGDDRPDRRQVDRLVLGDDLALRGGSEWLAALGAFGRPMGDGLIRMLGRRSRMTFVPRLSTTGLRAGALGLAVGRRRL